MFKIDTNKRSLSNLPLIVDNYEVIHFDDIPYLYYGTNKYGTKIIGSLLFEDEETGNLRYVHSLVDNLTFQNFINQKLAYRSLIEKCNDLFIVDKNINEKPIALYSVTSDLIPVDFLPVSDYYCPKYNFSIGNDFVLSLHGSIADSHLAFPIELTNIQKNFEKVLNKTLAIFQNLKISPTIKQRAYAPGSFQLRFNLSFDKYNEVFIKQELLYNSISEILKHLIPNGTKDMISEEEALKFADNDDLLQTISETFEKGAIIMTDKLKSDTKTKFQEIVNHYKEMSSNIGNGYKEIELLVEKKNSKDLFPMSLINLETSENLKRISEFVDSNKHDIQVDEEYKTYKVCIYSLNTETRVGKALIYNQLDKETMDKPAVKINGTESLEKTEFTESLHLNKWIDVRAKATLKDGSFSKLNIEGE
jgi:hypothetical protein